MSEPRFQDNQQLALAAASQANKAVADLLRLATEGPKEAGVPFNDDVVDLLLDAAKIAIWIAEDPKDTAMLRALSKRWEERA